MIPTQSNTTYLNNKIKSYVLKWWRKIPQIHNHSERY